MNVPTPVKENVIITEMVTMKSKVSSLLLNNPKLRDNDQLLTNQLWLETAVADESFTVNEIATIDKFLSKLTQKKYTKATSLRRIRAKLQEFNENLRGLKYNKRHQLADGVTEQIASV